MSYEIIAVKVTINLPFFLRTLLHCTKIYYRWEMLRINKEGINIYQIRHWHNV